MASSVSARRAAVASGRSLRPDGTPTRVLVVDDEESLAEVVTGVLRLEGFATRTALTGAAAVTTAREFAPDAIILDVMLPDLSGFEVLRRIRTHDPDVCVLFLTARDSVEDRIAGITAGGDDYVTKPFSLEEVLARVRGLLRRAGRTSAASGQPGLVVADLTMDEDAHEVRRAGDLIELTATEFELLRFLMRNPRRVLSKAQILDQVWNYDFGGAPTSSSSTSATCARRSTRAASRSSTPSVGPGTSCVRRLSDTVQLRWTRRPGRTLRARLTIGMAVVLLAAFAVAGVATTLSLRHFLLDRLDSQLASAGGRFSASLEHGQVAPDGDDGDADNAVGGQSVGTLGVRIIDHRITDAAVIDGQGHNDTPSFSTRDRSELLALSDRAGPSTIQLHALGDYRVSAVAGRDGDIQVTGLPTRGVDDVLDRLVIIEIVLFVVVVLVSGVVTALVVSRTLRPLRRVADTALHVSELPLTEAATPLPDGIGPPKPRTEVDQVSVAFDHMLEHLRKALAARDHTEQQLRRFVADASHELRTPLATIKAYAEFAARSGDIVPPSTATALARIAAAAARMATLVDDLLLLARLDAGRPLARETVDLSQLVLEAVDDARTAAADHQWHLNLPAEPVDVTGDAERLHQVVGNLLSNAGVHTPAGITVTTTLSVQAGTVTLEVSDNGPGIPDDLQPDLFDRFTRADPARAGHGSSGLGLAITRGIATAHHGFVTVSSEPGRTVFSVVLPQSEFAGAPQPLKAL